MRFGDLTAFQRDVYYLTLVATAISAACLIAPSAAHRLRFHKGERTWIIESANRLMIAGLVFLAVALGGGVLLITDIMFNGARVWIYRRARGGRHRRAVVHPAARARKRRALAARNPAPATLGRR